MQIELIGTVKLPTWALCPEFNDDYSGISEEDARTYDEWRARMSERAAEMGGYLYIETPDVEAQPDPYFDSRPCCGLACEVFDCKAYAVLPD